MKHSRGIYVHTHFLGGNQLVAEIERNLRISDNVLRFMTVRLATGVDGATRQEKAYERPQYDVEDPLDETVDEFGVDAAASAQEAADKSADAAPQKKVDPKADAAHDDAGDETDSAPEHKAAPKEA